MFGAEAKVFIVGDTEMNYVVFGKGKKPLLIIPGLSDGIQNVGKSSRALAFFYRRYAKRYKVFVCSRKNQLPTGYTTRDMAKDLILFMDAQNIPQAHVMGVSMGGMIVQHLAADNPDYVKKLIIAVSSSKPNQISNQVIGNWKRMIEKGKYGDFIVDTMEKTYTDKYLWKYRPFYFFLKKMGKPQSIQNFLVQADACLEHDAYERLPMIKCPTLVMGGEKDQIVGGEASRIISQQILGCQLRMYPGLGHGAFQESRHFEKDTMDFLIENNNT